jgi:hypothetical protein
MRTGVTRPMRAKNKMEVFQDLIKTVIKMHLHFPCIFQVRRGR